MKIVLMFFIKNTLLRLPVQCGTIVPVPGTVPCPVYPVYYLRVYYMYVMYVYT